MQLVEAVLQGEGRRLMHSPRPSTLRKVKSKNEEGIGSRIVVEEWNTLSNQDGGESLGRF